MTALDGKKKILIVEDSPTTVEILKDAVAKLPFPAEAAICVTGQEAVQYLNGCTNYQDGASSLATQTTPDFIILDLEIPEPHGLKVLELIRSTEALKKIPVVVNTTSANIEFKFKTTAYDRVVFLRKGFGNEEKVREAIMKLHGTP